MEQRFLLACAVTGSFLLLYVLYIFLKGFTRFQGTLPYFWDQSSYLSIQRYLTTFPSRHAYVIAGPYGTGKSQIMRNISMSLKDQKKFVVDIDVSEALKREDIFGFIKFDLLRTSPKLAAVNSTEEFFEVLEQLNCSALLVRGINKMRLLAPDLLDSAISHLSRRDLYLENVPVIAETSDSSFRFRNLPPCFRVIETGDLPDAKSNLCDRYKAFTSSEFKKITKLFGSHGGSYVGVFNDLKNGQTADLSIQNRLKSVTDQVKDLKNSSDAVVIKKICASGETRAYPQDVEKVNPLVNNGYLFVTGDIMMKPANKAVHKALCS